MNPIIKKKNKIEWKVENVDDLTGSNRFGPESVIDGLTWKICVRSYTVEDIKNLSIFLCPIIGTFDWLAEISANFKIIDKNGKLLKSENFSSDVIHRNNVLRWDLVWSYLVPSDNSKIDFITTKCEFSYKLYDFFKNPKIFSDVLLKVNNQEFHFSKYILSSASKFFNEKFMTSNGPTITIENVKSEDFLKLLAALLPNPIKITEKNYEILMDLSKKFKIPSLTKRCGEYFKQNQGAELIKSIKLAEKVPERTGKVAQGKAKNPKLRELINSLKRADEFKFLFAKKSFKSLQDSTKSQFYEAHLKLVI